MTGQMPPEPFVWKPADTRETPRHAVDVVRDFGASASTAFTTGDFAADGYTLTLAEPLDFVNGQGIVIEGAGEQGGPLVTTILGGGGTRHLTLATKASASPSASLVRHDDSWAWQAAIDAAALPSVITCPPGVCMNIAAPLRLRTGVLISFPMALLNWIGPDGGSVFTAYSCPLADSGILGGWVNPGKAACVVDLHGPQYCVFDLEVQDGTENLTVMRWDTADPADPANPAQASQNMVRRLAAGTCGTLLALSGQPTAPVSANTFESLLGRECHQAGVCVAESGYVDTNRFVRTDLTLKAGGATGDLFGIRLGTDKQSPGIQNLVFDSLSVRDPDGKATSGLCLNGAVQVQVLAYDHPGLDAGTAVTAGQPATYYIRSADQHTMADTTQGWPVTPLQVGLEGTPIACHFRIAFEPPIPLPPAVLPVTIVTVTVENVAKGDTVIATPKTPPEMPLVWSAYVTAPDTVLLYLASNATPGSQVNIPKDWWFDIWRHA
ncbi:MAG: hypothetical protein ACM3XM_00970 [Mycobacterium leprae]